MLRIIVLTMMLFCFVGCSQPDNYNDNTVQTGFVGEKEPVTRAEAVKMLALSRYSMEEINNLERTITFKDTDIEKWYDKYINAAYNAKLIAGTDDESFSPEDNLSLRQARLLINEINRSGNFELKFNEADRNRPISYKIWLEAFTRAVGDSVTECDIFVYATGKQCSELGDKYILCNGGLRGSEGIDFSPYADKIVRVSMRDNEILGISRIIDPAPLLKNAEIIDADSKNITIRLNGAVRTFEIDNGNDLYKKGDKIDITFDSEGKYQISQGSI